MTLSSLQSISWTLLLLSSLLIPCQSQESDTSPAFDVNNCQGPRTSGELRQYFLKNGTYDKLTRPSVATDLEMGWVQSSPPDVARIQLHILALNSVDQKRNEYELTAWFRRSWKDLRLAYPTQSQGGCFPDDGRVGFPESLFNEIWRPDFYIDNLVEPFKKVGGALWVLPNGEVMWSEQVKMKLACKMNFNDFPFDTQTCGFRVGTYLEDSSSVLLGFFEDMEPVTVADSTGEGTLPHGGTVEWTITGANEVTSSLSGSLFAVSTAELQLQLRRGQDYYISFVLGPAIMFVWIGWASFFIGRGAAPARVAMSMIGFLANTNFLVAQLGQLPRLGSDVWLLNFMTISTYFSFYAILEYVLCNYLMRIQARLEGARKKAREMKSTVAIEEAAAVSEQRPPSRQGTSGGVTRQDIIDTGFNRKLDLIMLNPWTGRMWFKDEHVDIASRYIYPIAYISIFLYYWFRGV